MINRKQDSLDLFLDRGRPILTVIDDGLKYFGQWTIIWRDIVMPLKEFDIKLINDSFTIWRRQEEVRFTTRKNRSRLHAFE